MMKFIDKFETYINSTLIVMLAVVVMLATVDLGWVIIKDVFSPPYFILDVAEILEIFGAFLLVMIGIELLGTVKTYISKKPSMSRWCCWWQSSPSLAKW